MPVLDLLTRGFICKGEETGEYVIGVWLDDGQDKAVRLGKQAKADEADTVISIGEDISTRFGQTYGIIDHPLHGD